MFVGFNLNLDEQFFGSDFAQYIQIGSYQISQHQNTLCHHLDDFIVEGNFVNGTQLQDNWFPVFSTDIFISHSHWDKNLALALAGWLFDTFGLTSFIDSVAWGYIDDLLEALNSRYSNKRKDPDGGYLYSHNACNIVSQHVNIMLSVALQEMMDETEAVFLLNTPNSLPGFTSHSIEETYSPWIFSEINCSKLIRKRPLSDYRPSTIIEHAYKSEQSVCGGLSVCYKVSTDHLYPLNKNDLANWKTHIAKSQMSKSYLLERQVRRLEFSKHALDVLYIQQNLLNKTSK